MTIRKPFGGISASTLRFIAMACMLLDHMWATIIPGNNWMTYVGRMAFPIFAFQLVEGYFHSSDRKQYGKRLLILAIVSEIPFNLMHEGTAIFPYHQNTVFTLLLGLWAISALDRAFTIKTAKATTMGAIMLLLAYLLGTLFMVDYGSMGVLTVVAFYLFHNSRFAWLGQLASMFFLNIMFFEGMSIPLFGFDFPTQGFAVLALIPIWLYNGQKGIRGKSFQMASYIFYPAHMLILYLLAVLL